MQNRFGNKMLWLALLLQASCGFNNPTYVPYEKPEGSEENNQEGSKDAASGAGGCPDSAVAVFAETVGPAIATACANCHVEGQHSMPLSSGEHAENRAKLLAWNGLNATKLAEFISSKPPHEGGDQSASLPAEKIGFWIDAEKACAE